ncbi:hypothetical protein VB776_04240 [Arcicella sp. DC2W]|uniref:Uncharacterized protein n=1 Tax=Arcicella gelida TaxID=2984195 RepID=A0ABU5S0Y9_9BACT|nr:hypothetical protein [Arcicella sp. DC2W]MEA5402111.1 hypothetical protein [Arcicella sp. DC2W]
MNLDFIEINTASKPKATIHITGKLGLNREAVKYMNINESTYFRIALDKDAKEKKDIFFVTSDKEEAGAIKVSKSGEYFFINLSTLFDTMKLEYDKYTIAFDITKDVYEGKDLYILRKRKKDKIRDKTIKEETHEE